MGMGKGKGGRRDLGIEMLGLRMISMLWGCLDDYESPPSSCFSGERGSIVRHHIDTKTWTDTLPYGGNHKLQSSWGGAVIAKCIIGGIFYFYFY